MASDNTNFIPAHPVVLPLGNRCHLSHIGRHRRDQVPEVRVLGQCKDSSWRGWWVCLCSCTFSFKQRYVYYLSFSLDWSNMCFLFPANIQVISLRTQNMIFLSNFFLSAYHKDNVGYRNCYLYYHDKNRLCFTILSVLFSICKNYFGIGGQSFINVRFIAMKKVCWICNQCDTSAVLQYYVKPFFLY